MIPARFVVEYPERCLQLMESMEKDARAKNMLGSFSLLAASAVFTIPYERMKSKHPMSSSRIEPQIYRQIKLLEKTDFLSAPFWSNRPTEWIMSRIMNNLDCSVEWQDEQGKHPMSIGAKNLIEVKATGEVLRVIRNALAHGNIIYLDK